MKNRISLKTLGLVLCVLTIGLWLDSCSAAASAAAPTCVDSASGCGDNFKTCCSNTKCHYEYNGKKYNCDGTNCNQAAADLADDILANCSTANIDAEEILRTASGVHAIVEE